MGFSRSERDSSTAESRSAGISVSCVKLIPAIVAVLTVVGCGGGGNSGSTSPSPAPSPSPSPSAGTVTVSAGRETSGIDIEVGSSAPTLSLVAVGIGNTAGSVGVAVKRGTANTLLLAGQGIASGTQYSISQGTPADITVTQPSAADFCTTTDGTPCVSLNVSVSTAAALGPRNIMVNNSTGQLAVFPGGLIVVSGP